MEVHSTALFRREPLSRALEARLRRHLLAPHCGEHAEHAERDAAAEGDRDQDRQNKLPVWGRGGGAVGRRVPPAKGREVEPELDKAVEEESWWRE